MSRGLLRRIGTMTAVLAILLAFPAASSATISPSICSAKWCVSICTET